MKRVLLAFGAAVLIFVVGAVLKPGFASRSGIEAILVIASFTGFVVAGQALVVLIGGIDLSVPWVLTGAAILLVTSSRGSDARALYAVALTLGLGLAVGLVNGLGTAYLAVPAVVMTLGMNGILEGLTLGVSQGMTCVTCSSYAPPVVRSIVGDRLAGVPTDLLLWLGVAVLMTVLLGATAFGRRVYAVGNNPVASFLAGINVRRLTVVLYMLSGMFAALAGIVLVGYSGQPTLGMGDPFLFQSIAAIVIGGVSILGGRGHFLGPVAGCVTLVALLSVLRAENMPEWGRSVLYGLTILAILLTYGRERRST
jgi:ribose transport system permease protein